MTYADVKPEEEDDDVVSESLDEELLLLLELLLESDEECTRTGACTGLAIRCWRRSSLFNGGGGAGVR